jgi:hypothetical protein
MKFLTARYGFILLGMLLIKNTVAQVPDTSTAQKLIQWVFQPIDKSQIPSGYLEEYGCPIIPMSTFNGTLSDSNRIDMALWRTLYLQFQTGWVRSTANPSPAITAVNAVIKQNTSNELPVPVPIFIGSYNVVKSNAFSAGLLQYSSSTNQIFDVAGRTQHPYDAKTLFAACPNRKQTIKGTETFIVKSEMIWNNSGKSISQLQIDFASGAGFQNITVGAPFTVNYTDTGYKRWTIKATLNDNSVLQCYADYYVLQVPENQAARFARWQTTFPGWGIVDPVNGVHSGARVSVNYSVNNFSGTLRKPLIVVEGYDVSFVAPALQDNYDVEDFIRGINEPQGYDFNSQLDNVAGYDLVFIDFNNGADDIVRNAAVVQEVINRVNANKVPDNRFGNIRQQNVVMGLSMGGLCARYALANMTKNFNPTETKLLITHDSPHKGANVPLGLQYLIWMMGNVNLFGNNVNDVYPDYEDAISLLSAPATQQLLLYRATSETQFANNTFLDGVYRNMVTFASTDPQPTYRFVATSLGSECAHPLYPPYTKLLNVNGDGYFFLFPLLSYRLHTIVEAFALPASGSGKIARLKLSSKFRLFGLITIAKDYYNNTAYASGTQLPIDGVPGATNPIVDFVVPKYNLFVPIQGIFNIWGYTSVRISGTPTNFAFVPTASALDAAPYTSAVFSEKYVNGVNFNYPSAARTFIAQETAPDNATNNVHIRFTARNSRWMYNEMEGLANTENCSGECSPGGSFTISGSPAFCTSATYSVNAPSNANVTWSVSPAGIATLQSNGANATLTKNSTGNVTLVATVSLCGLSQTLSIPVHVGQLQQYTLGFDGFSDNTGFFWDQNKNYNFTVNGPGASNFAWTISTQYGTFWTPLSSTTSNPFVAKSPGSFSVPPNDVVVSFDETCGSRITLRRKLIYNYYNDPSFYYVTPNPASSTVTVGCGMNHEQGWGPSIRHIRISSMYAVVFDQPFSSPIGSFTVQVSNWPAGQYYVSIYNGVNWFTKNLLISH